MEVTNRGRISKIQFRRGRLALGETHPEDFGTWIYGPHCPAPGYMTFVARIHGPASKYLRSCQAAVQRVDPHIPNYDAQTLGQRLGGRLLRPRFFTTTVLFLSVFAL